MPLRVLSRLDTTKTQYYHFKATTVAGNPFDYATDHDIDRAHILQIPPQPDPAAVESSLLAVALLVTMIGQLIFKSLNDRVRREGGGGGYGVALMLIMVSSVGCVLASLGFFRFLVRAGIGGECPLSATIMSEFANKRTCGTFIAAVFLMQGFGILAGSVVTIVQVDIAWRLLLMLGAVPAVIKYYWQMMMPEIARYPNRTTEMTKPKFC
ncbi:hypothetical protein EUGRSUZ_F01810 [Eucalyptus grandis]|uniref:Uncharacterized protein n=2 Tax=Eucalyptus grandis TaxID=71139 RepID=A0ACC3KFT6_EUCGR|nr:hypothetical protein EUGRSUZ_F01810 [Eucalyptus grandis]